MTRVNIDPEMFRWARERAGVSLKDFATRFPKLDAWEDGTQHPTLKQVEQFAKAVHVPVGFLFLKEPPVENIPIPDFRTVANKYKGRPSPDLLETIYICQQRQEWYRDFARSTGEMPLAFVHSLDLETSVESAAEEIGRALGFNIEERSEMPTWADALRHFIEQADSLGILIMCSGVVLNNNHRRLNPEEFRGFSITDDFAPLVFINGADTKAAQMFTMAHELAHIWLGQSAISDSQLSYQPDQDVEIWCNHVAAELLVPVSRFKILYNKDADLKEEANRLARFFKVSTLVILRRIYDIGYINQEKFWQEYDQELTRLKAIPKSSGGNFYLTQAARVSKRFARALVISTLEGQTLHRDAFRMLGFSKLETFHELGRSVGVIL